MSAEQVGNMVGSLLIAESSKHWKEVGKYFFYNLTVRNISFAFGLKLKPAAELKFLNIRHINLEFL